MFILITLAQTEDLVYLSILIVHMPVLLKCSIV